MLTSNLAVRLWPYYKKGDPTAWLLSLAASSLGRVKRSNIRISPSPYDSAVVSKASSTYNIFNDGANRGSSN